jgi:FKBP-type peptidyl-prolyl cis-trans isomerase 2
MTDTVNKKDFVEIKYTGFANSEIFDSNIDSDLKKLNPKLNPEKTIVAIGEEMVVSGLDKALDGKELNKEYEIILSPQDSFGERKRELVKTIPLSAFKKQKFDPRPGMVLTLDNSIAKIIAVSGARVITDFNNPLAGKQIRYKFTITRIVKDLNEKVTALVQSFFKFVPKFEIGEKILIKGPKILETLISNYAEKFKKLLNKEIIFEELKPEKNPDTK